MSDEDSKTMMVSPKQQKSKPKQILSVKLVPKMSQLLNSVLWKNTYDDNLYAYIMT